MAGATVFNKVLIGAIATGAIVGGIVACGPNSDELLGGGGGSGGGGEGSDPGNGGWDSGASYNADGAIEPLPEQLFDQIEPQLVQQCGGACHQTGQTLGAPIWLGTSNEYATIKAYPGIVVSDVYSSKFENRPQNHPSSTLQDPNNAALLASVTNWLNAEAAALTAIPLPASATVDPSTGSVDLSPAATGLTGAKITFTATQDGDLLRFDNVMLVAPSSTGVHIVSPIFAELPPNNGAEVDNSDFSTVDLTAPAGTSAQISPVFYFPGWTQGSMLKIEFTKIETSTATADAGTATTTCKDLTDFQNSAAPSMKTNCVSCHGGGNPTAQSSMDLSALNTNDYATACTQARTQVNTTTPAQSNVLLAPLQQVNHPVKVFSSNTATGYTQIQTWVNKE